MRIDATGKVGIGTDSPSAKLELNVPTGDGLLINSADIATIKMKSTGGAVKNWGFATTNLAASDFGIYQSNSNGGDPITAGTARMYFGGTGNLGIGTTAPDSFYSGAEQLVVHRASGEAGITVSTANNTTGALYFADGTTSSQAYMGGIAYAHDDDVLTLVSGGVARVKVGTTGNLYPNVNNAMDLGLTSARWKDLYLSGSTNIAGNIDLAGSVNASGLVTANHIVRSHAGHNTARIEAIYDGQSSIATKGNMLMWVSEPGITYDAGGIGTNIHAGGQYYGRKYDNGYGVYMRFEKQSGDTVFYNTQGTSGSTGGQGTERLRIKADGELKPTNHIVMGLNKGINFAANANATGMSSEILDDYEEGSWTGTLTGASSAPSTAVTATGYYTKIGNMVTLWIEFNNRNITGASGTVKITGQPFTPASAKGSTGAGYASRGATTLINSYFTPTSGGILFINYAGSAVTWASTGTGTYVQATITFSVT